MENPPVAENVPAAASPVAAESMPAAPVEAAPIAEKSVPAPASMDAPSEMPAQAPASAPAPAPVAAADELKSESQPAPADANLPVPSANVSDSTKAEDVSTKKKFSIAPLKKVGPIRLVNGFRSSQLRPRISLETQKDVADNVRQWMYERRNKYEKFVDNVLGKASPLGAKQPAPGADAAGNEAAATLAAIAVATPAPVPSEAQRDPSGK